MSTVNSLCSHKTAIASRVNSLCSHKTTVTQRVNSFCSHKTLWGRINSLCSHKTVVTYRANSFCSHLNRIAIPPAFYNFHILPGIVAAGGGTPVTAPHPAILITITLFDGGGSYDLTGRTRSWNTHRARGEQATLDITLDNYDGALSPGNATNSPSNGISGLVNVDPFVTAVAQSPPLPPYTVGHPFTIRPRCWIQIKRDIGGVFGVSPCFVPVDYQVDDGPTTSTVRLHCVDFSEMLLDPDHFMTDIDAAKAVVGSSTVLSQILTAFGFPPQFQALLSPDYPVTLLHRTGTPMSWIKDLLFATQSWWQCKDKTFVVQQNSFRSVKKPAWTFLDGQNITINSVRRTRQGAHNEVVVQRLDANSRILANKQGFGLGLVTIQFTGPTQGAVANIISTDGSASVTGITWLGGSGTLTSNFTAYYGNTPATAVQFTLTPLPPFTAGQTGWPYRCVVTGTPLGASQGLQWNGLSQSYVYRYFDAADAAVRGRHAIFLPIVVPLIPNYSFAQTFAILWVTESESKYEQIRMTGFLNPVLELGEMDAIVVHQADLGQDPSNPYMALVDSIDEEGTGDSVLMTVGMLRPRVV